MAVSGFVACGDAPLGGQCGQRGQLVEGACSIRFQADGVDPRDPQLGHDVEIIGVGANVEARCDEQTLPQRDRHVVVFHRREQVLTKSRIVAQRIRLVIKSFQGSKTDHPGCDVTATQIGDQLDEFDWGHAKDAEHLDADAIHAGAPAQPPTMARPPSTGMSWPVMNPAPSLARNTNTGPKSLSGSPSLPPNGMDNFICWSMNAAAPGPRKFRSRSAPGV